jgi:hypothetical protein
MQIIKILKCALLKPDIIFMFFDEIKTLNTMTCNMEDEIRKSIIGYFYKNI